MPVLKKKSMHTYCFQLCCMVVLIMTYETQLAAIDSALRIFQTLRNGATIGNEVNSIESIQRYMESRRKSVAAVVLQCESMGLCCGLSYATDGGLHHPDCKEWNRVYLDSRDGSVFQDMETRKHYYRVRDPHEPTTSKWESSDGTIVPNDDRTERPTNVHGQMVSY